MLNAATDKKFFWLLKTQRWPLLAAIIAILLTLPSLWGGLLLDDYFARFIIHQPEPFNSDMPHKLDVFNFANGDHHRMQRAMDYGLAPWWIDLDFKGAFWRPLASLTHYLDNQLWPNYPALMHLQSIAWYALAVLSVALLYRRFMGATFAAILAALMFAMNDGHGVPVGFLSNRNILLACVFGVYSILAHQRWREDGNVSSGIWALIFYILALLSAEAGVAVLAYLIAYSLCLDGDTSKRRLISLLPYFSITVLWRIIWSTLGYGVHGITLYRDPLHQPMEFIIGVFYSVPLMITSLVTPIPAEIQYLSSALMPWLWWLFTLIAVITVYIVCRFGKRDHYMLFFALGSLLSLIPSCATLPQNRVLLFAGIGGFAVIAYWLVQVWEFNRWQRTSKTIAWAMIATHFVIAPIGLIVSAYMPLPPPIASPALHDFPEIDKASGRELIIVNHPLPAFQMHYLSNRAINDKPMPKRSLVLSQSNCPITLSRTSPNTLTMQCEFGLPDYLTGILGRLAKHFQAGDRIELSGLSITVLQADKEGMPTKVSFQFDNHLDDNRFVWYAWLDGSFKPYTLPALGETAMLPSMPAPLGMTPKQLSELVRGRLPSNDKTKANSRTAGI